MCGWWIMTEQRGGSRRPSGFGKEKPGRVLSFPSVTTAVGRMPTSGIGSRSTCQGTADMAGRRARTYDREDAPSPDEGPDIPAPRRAHDYDFLMPMILEIQKTTGALAQEIKGLSSTIEKQGQKLDKIDDVRVDLGKLQTEIGHLSKELGSTKDKLDKVRTWVIGAAAIVGAIVAGATIVVRVFPLGAAPAVPAALAIPSSAPAQPSLPLTDPSAVVRGRGG